MLQQCSTAQEQWGGVHVLVDRWLKQRHDVLLAYMELLEACNGEIEPVDKRLIDRFSEQLMDYISAGHFELYPQLCEEAKAFNDFEALEAGNQLVANLDPSTQMVLAFDGDYANPVLCQENSANLPAWLERLRKGLTERFAIEDVLIARLHAAHAPAQERMPAQSS
ncbi:sigma D regulator [Phytohalomonas tamaricis]|uniref:sigma D regulator n=1 Tax=Phytohalomonas tamaricis TaxID=2081032 RepID=UPI000D0AEC63|nr:sigma D regulator [Phytohalomonas tamaricis]